MQNQGKLRTLYLFKSCFQRERYLETVTDARRRKCLTQLRISSHTLEVESGRYIKKQISERICKCCRLNQVEDEKHFLCICPLYDSERYFFFKYIKDLVPSFNTLDDSAKMIWLMSCEDTDIIQKLANFVYKCFSLRNIR